MRPAVRPAAIGTTAAPRLFRPRRAPASSPDVPASLSIVAIDSLDRRPRRSSSHATRAVSPRVAGRQVRRDRPPVWRGRGVGGRAGHVRACHRLVGGAPAGRGGSRCVAARHLSGRPSGGASPSLARPRCRSAGAVRRGREHAARTAGRARPRGARVGTRRRRRGQRIRWQVREAVARSGSAECAASAARRGGDRAGPRKRAGRRPRGTREARGTAWGTPDWVAGAAEHNNQLGLGRGRGRERA